MQPQLADQPSTWPIVWNGGEVNLCAVSPSSGLAGEDRAEFESTIGIDVAQLGYFLHAAAPIPQAADEDNQVMNNLKAILTEAGMDFSHVVKTTIFLSDMNLFAQVNEIYGKYFSGDFPARETVAVKGLPKNANVEISMVAVIKM